MRRILVLGCAVAVGLAFGVRLVADDSEEYYTNELKKAADMRMEQGGKTAAEFKADYIEHLNNIIAKCDEYFKRFPAGNHTADAYFEKGRAYLLLSKVKDMKENTDKGLAAAAEAIKTDPKSEGAASAHGLYIQVYRKAGDKENLIKECQAIIKDAPPESDTVAMAYMYMGEAYEQMGKPKEAEAAYQAVVDKYAGEPGNKLAAMAKGRLASKKMLGSTPDIEFTAIDGLKVSLKEYRGNIVVVFFWASWDEPSKSAIPDMVKTYNLFQERGVRVISISLDDKKEDAKTIIDKLGMPWPTYVDVDNKRWDNHVVRDLGVRAIPTTLLIDRTGKVRDIGLLGARLQGGISKLLRESSEAPKPPAK